jgi:radical SAM protein with 4Fe4S-binding SPASM domain
MLMTMELIMAKMQLPNDCTFLPITNGQLLVSREYATFCPVTKGDLPVMHDVINKNISSDLLKPETRDKLKNHGFFDPPRKPKPEARTVQMQITNACNLACSYCCTNSGNRRPLEVLFTDLLEIVKQIPETLGKNTAVSLIGGEPLLVPWAFELANEIRQVGLPLTLFTNGILLEEDRLAKETARLVRQGMKVRVSLGGVSAESCDLISGSRRFDSTLQGLINLAAFGGTAAVDLMFTPQNSEEVARKLPVLRQRLPATMTINLGILYVSGRETGEHLFNSRIDLEKALDHVAFEAGVAIPAAQTSPVTYRREGCSCALGQHIHLRSDGTLFNCFKMEEKIGHLTTNGFAAAADYNLKHPHPANALPTCAGCPLATLCGGGCRSENLLYTGDPDTPPCGPWRVRVISELLAEEKVSAVEWPIAFLAQEALKRGIEIPVDLYRRQQSRHLIEV